jgi:hypothetical protein
VTIALTDDWWELSEDLADLIADTAGVELPAGARSGLVALLVDLITLVTCWPTTSRPEQPLVYLRQRRARMAGHAPWLYELPVSTRKLLLGTTSQPSVLEFALAEQEAGRELRLAWRNGLHAIAG